MPLKRLLVIGDVQDAAYRIFVRMVARDLGIKGSVRNLPSGDVEIICDTQSKELNEFLKVLKSCEFEDWRLEARVKAIEVTDMDDRTRPFTGFEIDYGAKVTGLKREEVHRQELLIFHGSKLSAKTSKGFQVLGQKVDGVGRNVQELGDKIDGVGQKVDGVGQAVKDMHGDMNRRFDKMEERYGILGKSLLETGRELKRMNDSIEHMIEKSDRTEKNVERLIEGNNRTNKSLETVSRALVKLIQKDISERKRTRKAGKK
jgi:acylphosphatase